MPSFFTVFLLALGVSSAFAQNPASTPARTLSVTYDDTIDGHFALGREIGRKFASDIRFIASEDPELAQLVSSARHLRVVRYLRDW